MCELVFVAIRVEVADLRAAGLEIADAFRGIVLYQLAGATRFVEQLLVRELRDVGRRILVELSVLGNLRSLGAVGAVAQDVAASAVGIVQQRKESFAGQLRASFGLATTERDLERGLAVVESFGTTRIDSLTV